MYALVAHLRTLAVTPPVLYGARKGENFLILPPSRSVKTRTSLAYVPARRWRVIKGERWTDVRSLRRGPRTRRSTYSTCSSTALRTATSRPRSDSLPHLCSRSDGTARLALVRAPCPPASRCSVPVRPDATARRGSCASRCEFCCAPRSPAEFRQTLHRVILWRAETSVA